MSDDGEDERTGIAEGGWRKETASSKTQLNKDMEKESGETTNSSTLLTHTHIHIQTVF